MFREMIRKKQALLPEECYAVLQTQPRGVLALYGDEGYPYAFPIDYYYSGQTGKIYFHVAKAGHKIDALKQNNKVSFCVYDEGYRREGEWALNIKSVIVFGKIRFFEETEDVGSVLKMLGMKYSPTEEYVDGEIKKFASHVQILELTPEYISGKLVNES